MEKQKKTTLEYTMHYGAILGCFWMFKYLFFIGEAYWVHFIYFFHMLNIVSALLMYILYLRYITETPDIKHGIKRCVLFILGICFFGSLFEGVMIYAYYAFINPEAFSAIVAERMGATESILTIIESAPSMKDLFSAEVIASIKEDSYNIASNKLIYLLDNTIGKLLTGFVFSLLIGLLTRDKIAK